MAFLAYFASLSAMGAFVFGLSILLEPAPVPVSAKRVVAEQKLQTVPKPPAQRVAATPVDETVTEPPMPVTQAAVREDDEAAPAIAASAPPAVTQDNALTANASAGPDQVSAASQVPAEAAKPAVKPKPRKAVRQQRPPTQDVEDAAGRSLRYVGVVDGIPTYQVVR